ncbi:MAG: SGNH/GDSL hydrolase family protein [Arenibacterium sp.]
MKRAIIAAACVASLSAPVHAAGVEDFFSSFYSFGDSLTDDGKFGLAGQGGLLEPPSFGGRFTNGLTWSEYIEDAFAATGDDTRNYALGGATASPVNPRNPVGPLGTLAKQIDAFTAELPILRNPGSNPLVSLWFGANDIFTGQSPIAAANFVEAGVRAISALGATAGTSFDTFLLFDLPSIPGAPGTAEAFNAQLDDNVASLRNDGFDILRFDPAVTSNAIIADFLNGSPLYGITELITPCAVSFTDGDPSSCLDNGDDPNTYFFADSVHPSAPVHLLTSQQVSAEIIASVPLPATLPLVLTALGGAVLVSRRRRKAA